MRIAAAAARDGSGETLLAEAAARALSDLAGARPDMAVLFATPDMAGLEQLPARALAATGARVLVGCAGEGIIGPQREEEQGPALSLWLACLPDTMVRPFRLTPQQIDSADSEAVWRARLGAGMDPEPTFILVGDPYTVDVNGLLGGINEFLPGRPVIGGMASGAGQPGASVLFLNSEVVSDGAVGVTLSGAAEVQAVVSQGCRPVGRPCIITRAEQNVIIELGGRKPLEVLNGFYHDASEADQQAMRQGLLIGRVINEQKGEFHRGDFLIRNLMGADARTGVIAVGDYVRVGITVQFQVRDATAAHEELVSLLTPQAARPPAGALLFSCNGRGTRMFPEKDHDVRTIRSVLGATPVAGFFCAGELGPIGGKNFIHGHTASLALFRPKA